MFEDEKQIDDLFQAIDDYFTNTHREQIVKDLIDAAGGIERFNEIFKRVE